MKKITTALFAILFLSAASFAQPYAKNDNKRFNNSNERNAYGRNYDRNFNNDHGNKKGKHKKHDKNCNRDNKGKHLGAWKNEDRQQHNGFPFPKNGR
jgi:hypothetical protein